MALAGLSRGCQPLQVTGKPPSETGPYCRVDQQRGKIDGGEPRPRGTDHATGGKPGAATQGKHSGRHEPQQSARRSGQPVGDDGETGIDTWKTSEAR